MPASAPSWSELAAGWELGIYRAPIACGVLAGLLLGYLGVYVVLRRMVFITAAVSQAAGLGVALAFYAQIHLALQLPEVVAAVALALFVSMVLALPLDRLPISRESLLGVAYLAAWAGSLIVGDRISQEAHDVAAILFGTAVLVRSGDLYTLAVVAAVTLLFHLVFHRASHFALFDPEGARVQGVPVRRLELASQLLVALSLSVATRALGVLPVFAFAVMPAVCGLLVCEQLRSVLACAALVGALAGGGGYLLAFFGELPVGACQTAVATAAVLLALLSRGARAAAARPG
jgi:zinc transport system permease protein